MQTIPNQNLFDAATKANIDSWLSSTTSEAERLEFEKLAKEQPQAVIDAFYKRMSFGTGGLRGLMGMGTNRMNAFTVGCATQGLANYLNKTFSGEEIRVLIGFDSRNHSKEFAQEAARVLAGNGIKVFLFKDLRPVPLVSYSCMNKKCHAAVMITASHNPPEYNGYKVYWQDGGQVLPPHDTGIIEEVNRITDGSMVKFTQDQSLIETIETEMDIKYLEDIDSLQLLHNDNQMYGNELKVVYSSLHGTGITLVPQALAMWGFTNVSIVNQQKEPDGNFPTVSSPNPENHDAMKLCIEELKEKEADIVLATDPDCDRVGVAFKHHNEILYLDGNTIACLCLEHVANALTKMHKMPKNAAFVKTIVTTELFKAICDHYKAKCFDVLTGFKYIAQRINEWETSKEGYQFIFGGEESYGYLLGTFARDKDAVVSCALIAEVALQAKRQGKTLLDLTHEMYQKHGVFRNKLVSVDFPETKEGREQMQKALEELRENQPEKILGSRILIVEDYLKQERKHLNEQKVEPISLPKSNVIRFTLEDGTVIAVRPSGTEPKVKLYCGTRGEAGDNLSTAIEHCDVLCTDYIQTVMHLLKG